MIINRKGGFWYVCVLCECLELVFSLGLGGCGAHRLAPQRFGEYRKIEIHLCIEKFDYHFHKFFALPLAGGGMGCKEETLGVLRVGRLTAGSRLPSPSTTSLPRLIGVQRRPTIKQWYANARYARSCTNGLPMALMVVAVVVIPFVFTFFFIKNVYIHINPI